MSLRQQIRLFLRSTQVPRASLGVSSSRKTHANGLQTKFHSRCMPLENYSNIGWHRLAYELAIESCHNDIYKTLRSDKERMRKQARPTGEDIMTNRIMPIVVWGLCFLPSRALFPLLEMASLLPEPSGTSLLLD